MRQVNMSEFIAISSLYRYPIKGLNPEKLDSVQLVEGATFPWDRAYAIENGPSGFDAQDPAYFPKTKFLMLMRNEKLAELRADFDEETRSVSIRKNGETLVEAPLETPEGRARIEAFMADYMQDDLKGPPRLLSAPDHSFSDMAAKCVHIVNLASVREFETRTECALDPLRFRANIYVEGAPAWAEKQWAGKSLRIGDAELDVFAETTRCAATDVDPATAKRYTKIPQTLLQSYDHSAFGVYAKVRRGGAIRTGDRVEL
jgi:uncharacterized protein YcbX